MQESRREWMLWLFKDEGLDNPNNTHYQFWQQDKHRIELDTNAILEQKLAILIRMPVRAGICYTPEEYIYSSAGQYATMETDFARYTFAIVLRNGSLELPPVR